MDNKIKSLCALLLGYILLFLNLPAFAQKPLLYDTVAESIRTDAYAKQLEDYLHHNLIDEYEARAAKTWNRDYSSGEALKRSVEPNRKRWELVLGSPELRKSGPLTKKPFPIENVQAEWIELPLGRLTAQALLAFPEGASAERPCPIVLVQHGIASSPETPFGEGNYHQYAIELLKAGFAVLIPMNLRSVPRRNHIERLCRLANTTLPGIELARVQHLLDIVLEDPRIDAQRLGMWGVSLGGMATMFWMPLEPRIRAGIVSAWFNERRNKMVLEDTRFVGFMATDEDHAFFKGWLTEFSDYDVVSMICPRPLMVQHGKKDRIAHWPHVVEEFEKSKVHYTKLKMPEKIELVLHEGGHEAIITEGVAFMNRWLGPGLAPVPASAPVKKKN